MLLSAAVVTAASAADIVSVEKAVDYENEKIYINVKADGEVDYFNLIVTRPDTNAVDEDNAEEVLFYAKQQKSGSFVLNFPKDFGEEDCGLYSFTVGGNMLSKTENGSFYLTDIDNYNSLEGKLNDLTDKKELAKLLTQNSYVIGIAPEDYTLDVWSQPIITVLNIRDESGDFDSFADFVKAFEKACRVCEISALSADTVEKVLLENAALFELNMGKDSAYAKFNEEQKKAALGIFLKKAPFKTDKALTKVFSDSVFLTRVNNSYESEFSEILKDYSGDIKLEDYTELTASEFSKLFDSITKAGSFDDIDEFAKAFNDEAEDIIDNRSNRGSGGGSGGGSGSSVIGSAAAQTPDIKPADIPSEVLFADLEGYGWAEEAINYLAKEKIVSGYEGNIFKPSYDIRREEFVKILVDAFGFEKVRDTKMQLSDVKEEAWYYPYIEIAYNVGITHGKDDSSFGVGENITRQDMAAMLNRCLLLKDITLEADGSKSFADDNEIAPYAKESIYALNAAGIVNGYDDNSFKPFKNASRAEAAQMIYYTIKNVYGED